MEWRCQVTRDCNQSHLLWILYSLQASSYPEAGTYYDGVSSIFPGRAGLIIG